MTITRKSIRRVLAEQAKISPKPLSHIEVTHQLVAFPSARHYSRTARLMSRAEFSQKDNANGTPNPPAKEESSCK